MPNDSTTPQESEIDIAEAAEALAEIPAEVVVVNHVMGLYELAAIHLSAQPPRLFEAALAMPQYFGRLVRVWRCRGEHA